MSTASNAPFACAISASAWISAISANGLDGDSTNNSLVSGRTAFFHASKSRRSTNVISTPNLAIYFSNKATIEPKTALEQIT